MNKFEMNHHFTFYIYIIQRLYFCPSAQGWGVRTRGSDTTVWLMWKGRLGLSERSRKWICEKKSILQIFIFSEMISFNFNNQWLRKHICNFNNPWLTLSRLPHCLDYHGKIIDSMDSWSSENSNLLISLFIIIKYLYKTVNYFLNLF